MSKQVGTFILPDNIIEDMKDKIKYTRKLKIELGFSLCSEKDSSIIIKGSGCTGNRCSIRPGECREGQDKIGDYHTHPVTESTMSISDMIEGCSQKMECIGSAKFGNIVCFVRKANKSQCLSDTIPFRKEEYEILEKNAKIRAILNSPKSIIETGIYNVIRDIYQQDNRTFKYNANRIKLLKKNFDRIGI